MVENIIIDTLLVIPVGWVLLYLVSFVAPKITNDPTSFQFGVKQYLIVTLVVIVGMVVLRLTQITTPSSNNEIKNTPIINPVGESVKMAPEPTLDVKEDSMTEDNAKSNKDAKDRFLEL
jgi:uncharacterized membrane-anchored protein